MFRSLLSFLLALSFLQVMGQGPGRDLVNRVKDATVFLEVVHDHPLEKGNVESSGTGFFLDEHGRIATNNHVVSPWVSAMALPYPAPIKSLTAFVHSGSDSVQKISLRILARDPEHDLAILAPKRSFQAPAHLSISDADQLYETMPTWAFGYPYGKEHSVLDNGPGITVTKGNISALRYGDRDTLRTVQMDASVAPGNSGGPLITSKGKVVGVVFRKGENKMNEAVPGHYLARMVEKLPEKPLPDPLSLQLETDPPNARIFIDGKDRGRTPFRSDSLQPGLHRIDIYKEGHRAAYELLSLRKDSSVQRELQALDPQLLQQDTSQHEQPAPPSFELSETLFTEDFDDRDRFRDWDQNTGGLSKRTWYLDQGKLRQYQRDGTLHAITLRRDLGEDPYRISARVRIPGRGTDGDDRAGLIFGDGPKGFYLFRIYRGSNKAELAYHSRSPFGWTILQSHRLQKELSPEEWYDLSVSVLGDRVLCRIDGEKVIDLEVSALEGGDLGFYSVESKPAFDSLRVERLKLRTPEEASAANASTESFWFTDRFDRNSGWWWPSTGEPGELLAPYVGSVGTILDAKGQGWYKMGFERYLLGDMSTRAIISTGEGGEKAAFEWSFLENEKERFFIRVKKEEPIRLYREKDGKEELLASDSLNRPFFGGPTLFNLTVHDGRVTVSDRMGTLLQGEMPSVEEGGGGRFSFRLRDCKGVFHRMTVSSVDRAQKEAE